MIKPMTPTHRRSFIIGLLSLLGLIILAPGVVRYVERYNAMEHTLAQKNSATIISVLPAQTQQPSMGESTVRAEVKGTQHAAIETPIKIAKAPPLPPAVTPPAVSASSAQHSLTVQTAAPETQASLKKVTLKAQAAEGTALIQKPSTEKSKQVVDVAPLNTSIDTAPMQLDPTLQGPFAMPADQPVNTADSQAATPKTQPIQTVQAKKTPVVRAPLIHHAAHQQVIIHPSLKKAAVHSNQVIQVASFTQSQAAHRLANRLKADGYHAFVRTHASGQNGQNGQIARVLVRPKQAGRAAAHQLNQALFKRYRISGYIRQLKG